MVILKDDWDDMGGCIIPAHYLFSLVTALYADDPDFPPYTWEWGVMVPFPHTREEAKAWLTERVEPVMTNYWQPQ